MSSPEVPANITRIFVAGYFTDSNDVATAGKLVVTPDFTRGINDAWRRIVMAAPTSMEPSASTGLAYVSVVAGDDPDLNPSNFTHTVSEPGGRKYQIFVSQDTPVWTAGTPGHPLEGQRVLWLNSVAPSDAPSSGVVQVVAGPQGPPGEVSAAQLSAAVAAAKLADRPDLDTTGAAVGSVPAVTQVDGAGKPTAHRYVTLGPKGNRLAALTDSFGVYYGNSTTQQGHTYIQQIIARSAGRIEHGGVFGVGGYTVQQVRDNLLPQIEALSTAQRPDYVLVQCGTNNTLTTADLPAARAALEEIYDRLAAIGCRPVGWTLAPRGDDTGANQKVQRWNDMVRRVTRRRGLHLIDAHAATVDPATGVWKAGLATGDNIHPTPAGMAAIAAHPTVAGFIDSLPAWTVGVSASIADDTNLIGADGLFQTGTTIGNGWTDFTATAWTLSLLAGTTDDDLPGRWQQVVQTNAAAGGLLRKTGITGWSVGDRVKLSARFQAELVAANGGSYSLSAAFRDAGNTVLLEQYALWSWGVDFLDGLAQAEMVAPAGATQLEVSFRLGTATTVGTKARVGAIALRNLTALEAAS